MNITLHSSQLEELDAVLFLESSNGWVQLIHPNWQLNIFLGDLKLAKELCNIFREIAGIELLPVDENEEGGSDASISL